MKPGQPTFLLSRRKLLSLAAALPALIPASALTAGRSDETERVKSASNEMGGPSGRWVAEKIRNHGVIGGPRTVIEIAPDGRVTGSGGCNRISGRATVTGAHISFGPMISTKMACTPAIMEQESEFLAALGDARLWRIDEQRDKLILVDGKGITILRLNRI